MKKNAASPAKLLTYKSSTRNLKIIISSNKVMEAVEVVLNIAAIVKLLLKT